MKKYKILFYGFRHGHINGLYKKILTSDNIEIAACIEENKEARELAISNLGAVFSDKSYDEWLLNDIDIVAIGGAYGDRGKAIIKALEAGKHVIADKPICTSLDELEEIKRLSEKKGLKVACMLDLRYLPQTLSAKRILESGELGAVRNVSFNGQHCIDYAHRPSWYFEEGMHGGTINDLSIHGIDLVRMLTGMEFSKIDAARTWNAYATKHEDFKDCALFMARLENGAGVLADVSYSAPSQVFSMPTYWEFRFWCDKGLLSFNYVDSSVTVIKEGIKEAQIIEGTKSDNDYDYDYDFMAELISEIENGTACVSENVFRSTETALNVQKTADKEE